MITIRFVSRDDVKDIQSIAHETWMSTYEHIYSLNYINNFIEKAYSREDLNRTIERDIQRSKRNFLIAEYNKETVGYAQIIQINDNEYELLRIYVRPKYQKLGIGKAFIEEFIKDLKPFNKLIAWVEKENDIGRFFYNKCGFKEVEELIEITEGHSTTLIKYELELIIEL
ncbi:MAG: GNAT family N-acetyltransferase [Candidatus Cohnella colombiensis]|uniref:GNAT family N-acetyltransferase n=1 Tax=Candidatus Cohnella colombiensis TaxID=3121368 RepID=A0AA95F016_9BACL|nr:MAG: GNAT family N-acetyltransferase [Cohnella sp.]